MAQLFFRYGAMSSGKSIEILKVAHNYEAQGRKIALMTSSVDDRSGVGTVTSRIGLHRKAEPISEDLNLFNYVSEMNKNDVESGNGTVACVLIDEAQFLKKHHVLNLLIFADKIEEMKTICHYCGHKATMNLRINSGKPVYEGEQVQIGGDESYYPVCRFHYFHPDKQR